MAGRVLSDASPLIALARVDGLSWLGALFGQVSVPKEVWAEVVTGRDLPGEGSLLESARLGGLDVLQAPAPDEPSLPDLDEGEAACIRWALADARPALLLMDERAGRSVASDHGIPVAGTAAVIGMARHRGLIPSAKTVFERLHGSDFRMSPAVIRTVLRRVGEHD